MTFVSVISLSLVCVSIAFGILLEPLSSKSHILFSDTNNLQRILLLTAHPDDECMFFAPTVLSLLASNVKAEDEEPKTLVYSLCLSVGNAEGLGSVREKELGRSLDILGVDQSKRWTVDNSYAMSPRGPRYPLY